MNKKARKMLAVFAMVLATASLRGWSAEGHQAAAIIAQELLTQSGQFAPVQAILGNLTLAQISTCPDELRALQSSGTQMSANCQQVFNSPAPPTGTSPWHFVDTPVTLTNPTPQDVATACAGNCVLTEVDAWGRVLADPTQSTAKRLQALSFVVHFIGDLHQPLHSATRGSDAGGNAEQVSINGSSTSLHHAWDAPLVSNINSNAQTLASILSPEIAAAQAEAQVAPLVWSTQAFQFARTVAYAGIPSGGGTTTLSAAYQQNATAVVRQQLARAGVRLSQFLANALSANPNPTPTPTPTPNPGSIDLIANGGFEQGVANPSPWIVASTSVPSRVINSSSTEPPRTGTWNVWLDGHGKTTTDTILQQVTLPSSATAATLNFWLHVDTAETSTTRMFDTMTVQLRDSSGTVLQTLATFSNLDHASGYQQHSFDVSAFLGRTVQVFMSGAEDFTLQTSFVVDDVSLRVTQ